MNRKSTLSTAIGLVLGSTALNASASLTTSATLNFTLGQVMDVGSGQTDIVGSYFSMDQQGNYVVEPFEKTPISSFNGIHIGIVQSARGSHIGSIDGSENPNIDNPWEFKANVGMHQTTSPITVNGGSGDNLTLDMSGWNVTWANIASIPMIQQGDADISCTIGSSCSDSSSYTLDAAFHVVGAGFTTVPYTLHLEGQVSSVPVPAAAWLFGSGMLGLIGISRRKKV